MAQGITSATMQCPTCRATQEWSDTCRRCKCDLSLLKQVAAAYRDSRQHCLLQLRAGQLPGALRAARQCHSLCPDDHSARLLALCLLLCGHWDGALTLANRAGEGA